VSRLCPVQHATPAPSTLSSALCGMAYCAIGSQEAVNLGEKLGAGRSIDTRLRIWGPEVRILPGAPIKSGTYENDVCPEDGAGQTRGRKIAIETPGKAVDARACPRDWRSGPSQPAYGRAALWRAA
jgi:hypothetical protein